MREIDIDQLAAALDEGATALDVRETTEHADGHVPGTVSLPMGRLTARLDELDPAALVHVVCASGNRSAAMTDVLVAPGFAAVNVRGGTKAWLESGRPVKTGTSR